MEKRTNKKAQIALFVIIAVVIVASTTAVLLLPKLTMKPETRQQVSGITAYASKAVDEASKTSLLIVGSQGGYVYAPERLFFNDVVTGLADVPYWLYHTDTIIPNMTTIESQISIGVQELLPYYVNWSLFDVNITPKNIEAKTEIEENKTIIRVRWPLEITAKDGSHYIADEEYQTVLPVRLGNIYEIARNATLEQTADTENICLSCLSDLGNENEMHFEINWHDNDTMIYTITDYLSIIDNSTYEFTFGAKIR